MSGDTVSEAQLLTESDESIAKRRGKKRSSRHDLPETLGRYVPERCLGEGGFGVVYRASDPALSRDVAIKLPHAGLGQNVASESVREKFAKEARSAAKLRHPNIVAVFDYGFSDQGAYIVYEFVPGRTLEDWIKDSDQTIGLTKSIEWVAILADALSYAASELIVHRDIKPANIMIDSHGRPQIMDFGLAVALDEGKAKTGGKIAGTPVYMSPEQARGETHLGPATDQYSLAAILYQLVSGVRPVQQSGMAAVAEVAQRTGPPTEPLCGVPADLRSIILKAMHRDPQQRYVDCDEFANDLRAFTEGYPVAANPSSVPRRLMMWSARNRSTAASLIVVLLLLLGITAVSTFAAWTLDRALAEKNQALAGKQAALERASASEAKAIKERSNAEAAEKLANENKRRAQEKEQETREALDQVLAKEQQRKEAELQAQQEKERRLQADEVAESTKGQLLALEEVSRSLRYAEWLTKSANAIARGETSLAIQILSQCESADRGWEWNWLKQNAGMRRDFEPVVDEIPAPLIHDFIPPASFRNRKGFQLYQPVKIDQYVSSDWQAPGSMLISDDRSFGVITRTLRPRVVTGASDDARLRILSAFDFRTESALDICNNVVLDSGITLISNEFVAVITQVTPPGKDQEGQKAYEIWSVVGTPIRVLQLPIASDGFIPSAVYLPSRRSIVIASESDQLTTFDTLTESITNDVHIDFSIPSGPKAIERASDETIILCSTGRQLYFIDSQSGEVTSGDVWKEDVSPDGDILWDQTKRFVSFHSPGKLRAPMTDPDSPPTLSSDWHVIDVSRGEVLATLPMPMSQYGRESGTIKKGDRNVTVQFANRQALPIVGLAVSSDGNRIAVKDASGGIWAWQRKAGIGLEIEQHNFNGVITQAEVFSDGLIGTDGVELKLEYQDRSPLGNGMMHRVQKLRRNLGGRIIDLAADPLSDRIASLDENGYVTVFKDRRRLPGVPQIPGAVCLEFAERGSDLLLGTNRGQLITVDSDSGQVLREHPAHNGVLTHIESIPDERMVVTTGDDRMLRCWDAETGLPITIPDVFTEQRVVSMCYEREQRTLIVCGNRSIALYRCTRSGFDKICDEVAVSHSVRQACLFDEGNRILVVGGRSASVLRASDGARLFAFPQQDLGIVAVSQSDGNPWLLLTSGTSICFRVQNHSSQ
ncbi:protein kinase [Roseiconus lacunae]|uniref:WD40 repeat domain-containing serine/threonine-protein kinase n=1 Tax=Roseiconus lacunae TaxID=2605694 RepID=UPI0030851343|nr:protein kinase [Stieleria sp. HD01]